MFPRNLNRAEKVVLISPFSNTILSFRGPLIKELLKRGFKVYVLSPNYSVEIKNRLNEIGVISEEYYLDRTGTNIVKDIITFLNLIKLMFKIKPDVVISYNIKPIIYGTITAWLMMVPRRIVLFEGLGHAFVQYRYLSFTQKNLRAIVKIMLKITLKKSYRAIFLNPDDMQELISLNLVDTNKSVCLGGIGVCLDEWKEIAPFLDPITFTMAARLIKEKGIYEFAEAARYIKKKYKNVRFILLGGLDTNPSGIDEDMVQKWVQEGILEWFGHVTNPRQYYAQTSVYVLPSYREGVPRSTQEAMAMGRAIITTDVPGCRETVIDGFNGFLVAPRDTLALAQAMERFILEPNLILIMGENSRRLAEERFDAKKFNESFIRAILS